MEVGRVEPVPDDERPPAPASTDPATSEQLAAAPGTDDDRGTAEGTAGGAQPTAGPADVPPRRPLKLVLTLTPADGPGYRAVLALGTAGCDPLLCTADVAGPDAALDEIRCLLADAEAWWQTSPRYPAAGPPSRSRAAASRAPAPAPAAVTPPTESPDVGPLPAAPAPAGPAVASHPAPTPSPKSRPGQLSLFG